MNTEDIRNRAEVMVAKSSLREEPDYEWIDALVMSVYHDQFKSCPSQDSS